VTVDLVVTPICPGPIGDAETASADGPDPDQSNNTDSGSVNIDGQAAIDYVTVTDNGYDPSALQVAQGRTIQWCFFGSERHHVADASGMNLLTPGRRVLSRSTGSDSWLQEHIRTPTRSPDKLAQSRYQSS